MKEKLLTVCPTMGRIDDFKNFYESFCSKTENKNLIVCLENSDVQLDKYFQFCIENKINYLVFAGEKIVDIFNKVCVDYFLNDVTHFHLTNDDLIYKTQNWDVKLLGYNGITYGDDGQSYFCEHGHSEKFERLATFPIISTNFIRALGYCAYPYLKHHYADIIWHITARKARKLLFFPDVHFEHKAKCELQEWEKDGDKKIFEYWYYNKMKYDVGKIIDLV